VPALNPAWNSRVAKILQQDGWTISKDIVATLQAVARKTLQVVAG
jgi:hypothetical protein